MEWLTAIPSIIGGITGIINRVIPDANQAAQLQQEITKELINKESETTQAIFAAAKAQSDVNLAEAGSSSKFVSGWRPFIGWICGFALLYGAMMQPLLAWIALGLNVPVPPAPQSDQLMTVLLGMLGLGAYRTYEKTQGVPSAPTRLR